MYNYISNIIIGHTKITFKMVELPKNNVFKQLYNIINHDKRTFNLLCLKSSYNVN